MGVTLERVQNKFACIIGELCSEPDILSQFAIWVDLRIAEYKANGAISLECTGSTPHPTWLKGLKPDHPVQSNPPLHRDRDQLTNRNARHERHPLSQTEPAHQFEPLSHFHQASDDLSASVTEDLQRVVVKEEVVNPADVFPVSLHSHNDTDLRLGNSWQRLTASEKTSVSSRKRQSSTTEELDNLHLHSNNGTFSKSAAPKARRVSSTSDNSLSAGQESNQSLLSLIRMADQAVESSSIATPVAGCSRGGNSGVTDQPTGSHQSVDGVEWGVGRDVRAEEGCHVTDIELVGGIEGMDSTLKQMNGQGWNIVDVRTGGAWQSGRDVGQPGGQEGGGQPEDRARWSRRMNRVKPHSTQRNTMCAVKTFRNWLQKNSIFREIETIPPAELDYYLVDFFSTIKQKNGADYHPNSLYALRKFLDFHLKDNGYPYSITTSVTFSKCQAAFRLKHTELQNGVTVKKATDGSKNDSFTSSVTVLHDQNSDQDDGQLNRQGVQYTDQEQDIGQGVHEADK